MCTWPSAISAPDPAFIAQTCAWMDNPAASLLGYIWTAYDNLLAAPPVIDRRDLERSITQLLEPRVARVMTGFEPFYVQHGTFERESMAAPPAQPPAYDLAFVLLADERMIWPLEAKVLETPGTLAAYLADINEQYLTCRYAPFSGSAAMLGYLLSGSADQALQGIAKKLGIELSKVEEFPSRPHRTSTHKRSVPAGKPYPDEFCCHHLIMEFIGLTRH